MPNDWQLESTSAPERNEAARQSLQYSQLIQEGSTLTRHRSLSSAIAFAWIINSQICCCWRSRQRPKNPVVSSLYLQCSRVRLLVFRARKRWPGPLALCVLGSEITRADRTRVPCPCPTDLYMHPGHVHVPGASRLFYHDGDCSWQRRDSARAHGEAGSVGTLCSGSTVIRSAAMAPFVAVRDGVDETATPAAFKGDTLQHQAGGHRSFRGVRPTVRVAPIMREDTPY